MKPKTRIILLIFCILLSNFLTLKVIYDSKQYSCEECKVNFKTKERDYLDISWDIDYSAQELYELLMKGECKVSFDKNIGFRG